MMRQLLALAQRKQLFLATTILAGFAGGILTLWQAWLLSQTISQVFLDGAALPDTADTLRLLLMIIVLRGLFGWISEVSANAVAIGVKTDLRQRLFKHMVQLGPAYTQGERSGELVTAAVEGIEALDAYFSQYLPQLALSALIPLSILVAVYPLDLLSGILLTLTAPLIPIFMVLIGKAAEKLTNRQYKTMSRLSAHFLDSLQGLQTLKLFGRSKAHQESIAKASETFRDNTLSVLRVTFLSALVLELVATLSTAIIAVEVGLRLLYFKLPFEQAFFLLVIAPEFYQPLRMLGLRFHAGMSGTSAAREIYKILNTQPNARTHAEKTVQDDSVLAVSPLIELQNITYTYPGEEIPILEDICLKINPGEHIALVGPSGAGKSTLVQLILGFIQPEAGEFFINGKTMNEMDIKTWRKDISWVSQNPYLFHDTIAANIRLGIPTANDDAVAAAAHNAHLEDFINSLPKGYQTGIMEGGARLSSGQAQRLALARAFLKNAPILILDEPTSNLDPATEAQFVKSIRKLIHGNSAQYAERRTVITIAHRLNTTVQADRILVMDGGKLCEIGTHSELLQRDGLYARLVNANRDFTAQTRFVPSQIASINKAHNPRPNPVWSDQNSNNPGEGFKNLPDQDALKTENKPRRGLIYWVLGNRRDRKPVYFRLLGFLKGTWEQVALSVLLGSATIASSIGLMGTSAWLISTAALHPSIAVLQVAVVGVRTFGISRGVFRYLERLTSHEVTFHLLARLRTWFYTALEPLAPARLMHHHGGDLLSRIVSDIETLENFYVRVVSPPLVALLVSSSTLMFIGQFDPHLAWALLPPLLGVSVGIPLITQFISRGPGADLVRLRAALHNQFLDGIQGLPDLLAFGAAEDQGVKIQSTSIALGKTQGQMSWLSGFNTGLVLFLSNLGAWLILRLSIPLVTQGKLEGVMLAVLTLVALASFEAVIPLPLSAQMLSSTTEAAQRLFGVIDTQAEVNDPPKLSPSPLNKSLYVQDLVFQYQPGLPPALDGISLNLEAGKKLAIVGPSGSGKSTLVHLLLRFWDFDSGSIQVDGRELQSYQQDDVRALFAVVPHNPYFFNTTIRENLLLARSDAVEAEIQAAAQCAEIHEFIQTLPDGYDTFIGEKGLRLSSGERGRLSIARAILKAAPILVTDEPTRNLDALTEMQILKAIFEAAGERSLLHITHRLIQLDAFDEIIVLNQGRIIERGSHADLLARGGLFQQMWEIQNGIIS